MGNPYDQYSQAALTGEISARKNEATALLATARDLRMVVDNWDSMRDQLDGALERNQLLWAVLSTEISENQTLPDDLKQNLLNLALFVFQRTLKLIAAPNPAEIGVLININRSLAQGLSVEPE
ncbi:MAG: flagellar protein FlaF [Alphaproteobacteria bacterium]|nr:flagellar protein FlaF [Alphaproteobacteria bacterium]